MGVFLMTSISKRQRRILNSLHFLLITIMNLLAMNLFILLIYISSSCYLFRATSPTTLLLCKVVHLLVFTQLTPGFWRVLEHYTQQPTLGQVNQANRPSSPVPFNADRMPYQRLGRPLGFLISFLDYPNCFHPVRLYC